MTAATTIVRQPALASSPQPTPTARALIAQCTKGARPQANPAERSRLVARIDAAVGSMNELFEALLDMTKLDAGILRANPTDFSIARLLERIAVHAEALTSHDETGCQMTSDKLRVRADRYIKTACAVTDPVHKL